MNFPAVKTSLVEVTEQIKSPCRVFLKKESEQPSGSFKLRGIGYLIGTKLKGLPPDKELHVFSSSGGNAGLAAAYSSKHYGLKCTVVLPTIIKKDVKELLQSYGAEVIFHGQHWGEADKYLREHIKELDESVISIYCHPFDDPIIWDGHGAMIDEVETQMGPEDLKDVKAVVCSVGGGGLLSGVVEGLLRSKNLQDVEVLAVESDGAPSYDGAIRAGKVISLPEINTMATSLGAPYVCERALEFHKQGRVKNFVIKDIDTVRGTVFHYDTFGEVVEPACGASVSLLDNNKHLLEGFSSKDIIIIILCGGVVTKESEIESYRQLL